MHSLQSLSMIYRGLPYKVVAQLMGVINKKENFLKYFVPCDLPKQKQ